MTSGIPTIVDVSELDGSGSPRVRPEGLTRSHAVGLDFLESANRLIRQQNAAGIDGSADLVMAIIADRLNSILIRATELEDPILKTILRSLGLYENNRPRPIRLSAEDGPRPGFGLADDDEPSAERIADISAAIRQGMHHGPDWVLAATPDTLSDLDCMKWIADMVLADHRSSMTAPKALVSQWRLHVAKMA